MKTLLTIAVGFLGFTGCLFAQGQAAQTAPATSDSTTLRATGYVIVEEMPEFRAASKG
jgi:hypothetical protein